MRRTANRADTRRNSGILVHLRSWDWTNHRGQLHHLVHVQRHPRRRDELDPALLLLHSRGGPLEGPVPPLQGRRRRERVPGAPSVRPCDVNRGTPSEAPVAPLGADVPFPPIHPARRATGGGPALGPRRRDCAGGAVKRSPAYFATPTGVSVLVLEDSNPPAERSSTSRRDLPISEQSIVLLVGEDLEDKDHGAGSRRGLNRIYSAICERELESPCVRERGRETVPRRELDGNSTLRNLVSGERVFVQARCPPPELLSLFGLKLRLGGSSVRSNPDLARREASQLNEPPSSPPPSITRARR